MLRSSTRRWLSVLAAGAALVCGAGAAWAQGGETFGETTWWLPRNITAVGDDVDRLFNFILYMTCFICVAVFVVLGVFLVRYRFRPGRQALFIHGNNQLETAWTLIPTIILALTAVFSQTTWSQIKNNVIEPTPEQIQSGEAVYLEVVGRQFQWYYHYPGKDGKLGRRGTPNPLASDPEGLIGLDRSDPDSRDDLVTPVMYVPVDTPVYIKLTSVDVIHSFFLLNFRIKQDAMPGLNARVWFNANQTSAQVIGTDAAGRPKPFDIICAELCGQGHFKMRGQLFVVSKEEYQQWLSKEMSMLGEGDDDGY